MTLSVRDLDRVAAELGDQGARVKRTKKGYMVFTETGSFSFHLTPSDENQERQMARDIVKAGLEIPSCMSKRLRGKLES